VTKIYIMLAYTHTQADRPVLAEVISNLRADGFEVETGIAETFAARPETLRVDADLYVLKSHSAMWLNLAAVLDAQSARILNSYASCVATLNKIRTAARLHAAAIPIPRSWVTGDLAHLSECDTPLLIKPNIGRSGLGIQLVRDRRELATTKVADGMLVQELIDPAADELKVYVVGEQVFGIRKDRESGVREPAEIEPAVGDMARRCGHALGLDIFGVDVMFPEAGPVVVDVNYFPSFKGVAAAPRALSDFIGTYARAS
jgi:ribosomal protein S6--L-glutamate ligase